MKGGDFFGNVQSRIRSMSFSLPNIKIPIMEKEDKIEELLIPESEITMYNRLTQNKDFRNGLGFNNVKMVQNINQEKKFYLLKPTKNNGNSNENYTFEVINKTQNGQLKIKKTTVRKNFVNMNEITTSEFILNQQNPTLIRKILYNLIAHIYQILFVFMIKNVNQELFVTRYFIDLLNELSTHPDFIVNMTRGSSKLKDLSINPVYQKIKNGKKEYFIFYFRQGLTDEWKGPLYFCVKVKKSRDDLYKLVKVNMDIQISPNGEPHFNILNS